jgi:hypothetical protein
MIPVIGSTMDPSELTMEPGGIPLGAIVGTGLGIEGLIVVAIVDVDGVGAVVVEGVVVTT